MNINTGKTPQGGRQLSVITALGRTEWAWLIEAGQSLNSLTTTAGSIGVEWIISIDAGIATPAEVAEKLENTGVAAYTIIAGDGTRRGAGPTRTTALEHVHGKWVMFLDKGDQVESSGIESAINKAEETGAVWVAGLTCDINEAGETAWEGPPAGSMLPLGTIPKGAIMEYVDKVGTMPLICGAVIAKTDTVREAGGWPDLKRGEDTSLVLVLSAKHEGLSVPEYIYNYRRHNQSVTRHAGWIQTPAPWEVIKNMAEAGTTTTPGVT